MAFGSESRHAVAGSHSEISHRFPHNKPVLFVFFFQVLMRHHIRFRLFIFSVHTSRCTTPFFCTKKKNKMMPSPKQAVTLEANRKL